MIKYLRCCSLPSLSVTDWVVLYPVFNMFSRRILGKLPEILLVNKSWHQDISESVKMECKPHNNTRHGRKTITTILKYMYLVWPYRGSNTPPPATLKYCTTGDCLQVMELTLCYLISFVSLTYSMSMSVLSQVLCVNILIYRVESLR